MAKIHDLRSYLDTLSENGRLMEVDREVNLVHEIGSVIATAQDTTGGGVRFIVQRLAEIGVEVVPSGE